MVVTANGEVQTKAEAQSHVHDLDLFVTVQLLEETPAVPSLPKKGRQLYAKRTISVTLDLCPTNPAQERSDVQASGNCSGSPPKTQIQFFFQTKKRNGNRDSDDRLRGLPEWLEEFTDDLEDTELHAPAHTSQDSESERPTKVEAPDFLLTSRMIEIAKSAFKPK